jgi:hypothetical protein
MPLNPAIMVGNRLVNDPELVLVVTLFWVPCYYCPSGWEPIVNDPELVLVVTLFWVPCYYCPIVGVMFVTGRRAI